MTQTILISCMIILSTILLLSVFVSCQTRNLEKYVTATVPPVAAAPQAISQVVPQGTPQAPPVTIPPATVRVVPTPAVTPPVPSQATPLVTALAITPAFSLKQEILANIPVDLIFYGFYDTSNRNLNVVDPVKQDAYETAMKYVTMLTTFLNTCRTQKNVADYAEVMRAMCAKNAFLGAVNEDSQQGLYVRSWRLSTVSFAFIALSPYLQATDRNAFRAYIQRYQNVIIAKTAKIKWDNNHRVWELQGLILSSIALQQPITTYVNTLLTFVNSKMDDSGFISSEKRGYRTRLYHNFFLKPLTFSLAMNKIFNSLDTSINKTNLSIALQRIPIVIKNLKEMPIATWRTWLNANGQMMPESGDDNMYEGTDYDVSNALYNYIVANQPLPPVLTLSYLDNIAPFFAGHVYNPVL